MKSNTARRLWRQHLLWTVTTLKPISAISVIYSVPLPWTGLRLRWESCLRFFGRQVIRMMMMKGFCLGVVVVGLVASGGSMAGADSSAGDSGEANIVTKEITGEVSALKPDFITLVYHKDKEKGVENEIWLSLSKSVEVKYKRQLNEIKSGDTVTVTYEEKQAKAQRLTPKGETEEYMKVLSREATVIAFLKPAQKALISGEK